MAPLCVSLLLNLLFFAAVMRVMHRAAGQRRGGPTSKGLAQSSWQRELRAAAAVATLLGLSWVFGALVSTNDTTTSLLFQYIFAICTTLQGFSVFLFYCVFNDGARDCLRQTFRSSPGTSQLSSSKGKTRETRAVTSKFGAVSSSRMVNTLNSLSIGDSTYAPDAASIKQSRSAGNTLSLSVMSNDCNESIVESSFPGHALGRGSGSSSNLRASLQLNNANTLPGEALTEDFGFDETDDLVQPDTPGLAIGGNFSSDDAGMSSSDIELGGGPQLSPPSFPPPTEPPAAVAQPDAGSSMHYDHDLGVAYTGAGGAGVFDSGLPNMAYVYDLSHTVLEMESVYGTHASLSTGVSCNDSEEDPYMTYTRSVPQPPQDSHPVASAYDSYGALYTGTPSLPGQVPPQDNDASDPTYIVAVSHDLDAYGTYTHTGAV